MTQVSFLEKSKNAGGRMLATLQKVGKSLVFPIAVLPAAAILMRMGELVKSYGSIEATATALDQFTY
jgi:PTS system N-acetylglucosamine-specific IIC component